MFNIMFNMCQVAQVKCALMQQIRVRYESKRIFF